MPANAHSTAQVKLNWTISLYKSAAMKDQNVGYIRVSSTSQNIERQLVAVALGRVFTDKVSGKETNRAEIAGALRQTLKKERRCHRRLIVTIEKSNS